MARYVIGVDVHKRTHTFVAVDQNGRELGKKTVPATSGGHASALNWARSSYLGDRLWGVEDVRPLSTLLELELLDANEPVVRVPPKLTARQRVTARTFGKSDSIDALAVARAVLREPDLPIARHDLASRELKLLVNRRDDLVTIRTETYNRLLGRLHELDPEKRPATASLRYACNRQAVIVQLDNRSGTLASIARDEVHDLTRLTEEIQALAGRIETTVRQVAPSLLLVPGCGPLTAAKIVGETADVARFSNEARFASYAGLAPIPQWSGNSRTCRTPRHGNRQLNRALHTIALTQIRKNGAGENYYRRRVAEGDSHAKAMRCLKRILSRVVYRWLKADREVRENYEKSRLQDSRTLDTSKESPHTSSVEQLGCLGGLA
jgi:transposase